jgi:hypothetical protein
MAAITVIRGLQNLTNLEFLRLDDNSGALESIDVSEMTSLIVLDLSDMEIPGTSTPSLKQVNVSGCINLRTLLSLIWTGK